MADKPSDTSQKVVIEHLSEIEKLKRDVYRPDMEKFRIFTQMLRTNALLKKEVIRHKKE